MTNDMKISEYKKVSDKLFNWMQDLYESETPVNYIPPFFTDRANNLYIDRPNVEYTEMTFHNAVETFGVYTVADAIETNIADSKFSNLLDELEDLEYTCKKQS